MKQTLAFRTRIIRYRDDAPARTGCKLPEQLFEYFDDGVLLIDDGKINTVEHAHILADQGFDLSICEHLPEQLVFSGFIDSHVHAPQLDVMGAYGEQLMDWLSKYTFPAEMRFAEQSYSAIETARFLRLLQSNGTTSAMIFTTSFKHSTEQLFEQAKACNMRIIAGKVMMDRNAPAALLDTAEQSAIDSDQLIQKWHNNGRLGYALTPRFAGTSTVEQLQSAEKLLQNYPDLWVQTHLSENLSEIAWTKKLFPQTLDYLDTYDQFGLVGSRSMFAHCLHLNERELTRLAQAGSAVSFCPSSNLFLGSGLFDLAEFNARAIPTALASDVGAGTSLSMLRTMGDAYKVCQLKNYALSAVEAFYMTTLGAARALHIDRYVGSLMPGKEADFVFLNSDNIPFVKERITKCRKIEEELFVYMTCADERLIDRTYISGKQIYQNSESSNFQYSNSH